MIKELEAKPSFPLLSISVEEFKTPPEKLEKFTISTPTVTRENFIHFFAHTFAVSRGDLGIQLFYLEWLKAHRGIDFRNIFSNFIAAGGQKCLSDKEKEEYISLFRNVSGHQKQYNLLPSGEKRQSPVQYYTDEEVVEEFMIRAVYNPIDLESQIQTDDDILSTIDVFAEKLSTKTTSLVRGGSGQIDSITQEQILDHLNFLRI